MDGWRWRGGWVEMERWRWKGRNEGVEGWKVEMEGQRWSVEGGGNQDKEMGTRE